MPGLSRAIVIVRNGKPIGWANTRGETIDVLDRLPADALPEIGVWSVYHVDQPSVSHDDTHKYLEAGRILSAEEGIKR